MYVVYTAIKGTTPSPFSDQVMHTRQSKSPYRAPYEKGRFKKADIAISILN